MYESEQVLKYVRTYVQYTDVHVWELMGFHGKMLTLMQVLVLLWLLVHVPINLVQCHDGMTKMNA